MSLRQKAVLAGLAIALVSISACQHTKLAGGPGPGQHYGRQDPRVFEVYIYADPNNPGKCLADWPVGTLWQDKHQTVLWISDDGGEYTVDFKQGHHSEPKSPFHDALTFDVPSNGKKASGNLEKGASGYYDFAIRSGGTNCKEARDPDPGYYVRP